jgi:hypothetical protein
MKSFVDGIFEILIHLVVTKMVNKKWCHTGEFSQGKNQVLKVTGNSKNSYVIPLPKKINSWKSTFSKCTVDDGL